MFSVFEKYFVLTAHQLLGQLFISPSSGALVEHSFKLRYISGQGSFIYLFFYFFNNFFKLFFVRHAFELRHAPGRGNWSHETLLQAYLLVMYLHVSKFQHFKTRHYKQCMKTYAKKRQWLPGLESNLLIEGGGWCVEYGKRAKVFFTQVDFSASGIMLRSDIQCIHCLGCLILVLQNWWELIREV